MCSLFTCACSTSHRVLSKQLLSVLVKLPCVLFTFLSQFLIFLRPLVRTLVQYAECLFSEKTPKVQKYLYVLLFLSFVCLLKNYIPCLIIICNQLNIPWQRMVSNCPLSFPQKHGFKNAVVIKLISHF